MNKYNNYQDTDFKKAWEDSITNCTTEVTLFITPTLSPNDYNTSQGQSELNYADNNGLLIVQQHAAHRTITTLWDKFNTKPDPQMLKHFKVEAQKHLTNNNSSQSLNYLVDFSNLPSLKTLLSQFTHWTASIGLYEPKRYVCNNCNEKKDQTQNNICATCGTDLKLDTETQWPSQLTFSGKCPINPASQQFLLNDYPKVLEEFRKETVQCAMMTVVGDTDVWMFNRGGEIEKNRGKSITLECVNTTDWAKDTLHLIQVLRNNIDSEIFEKAMSDTSCLGATFINSGATSKLLISGPIDFLFHSCFHYHIPYPNTSGPLILMDTEKNKITYARYQKPDKSRYPCHCGSCYPYFDDSKCNSTKYTLRKISASWIEEQYSFFKAKTSTINSQIELSSPHKYFMPNPESQCPKEDQLAQAKAKAEFDKRLNIINLR